MNQRCFRLILIAGVACVFAASAWAKQFALTASHLIPAANGTIDAHVDKNGNTGVDIKVRDLAHPGSSEQSHASGDDSCCMVPTVRRKSVERR
jgi:hypothetical protein